MKRKAIAMVAMTMILGMFAAGPSLGAPKVKGALKIVEADMADAMFTAPDQAGAKRKCPARATLIKLEGKYKCLWCPPGYHGHARLKDYLVCYQCRTKNAVKMSFFRAEGRGWCVKCGRGYRFDPKKGRCLKR